MTRRVPYGVAAALAVAAILLAVAAHLQDRPSDQLSTPHPGTFRVLDQPQTAEDRSAIDGYTGESAADLTNAHLLAVDPHGRRYLLAPTGTQLCLVVLLDTASAGWACDPEANTRQTGTWLKGSDGTIGGTCRAYLAILMPDEYSDAVVQAASSPVLRTANLIVLDTRPDLTDRVTIHSDRLRDIQVVTGAR